MIQSGSSDSFLISYRMNRLTPGISGKKQNKLSAKSTSMPELENFGTKLLISESEFFKISESKLTQKSVFFRHKQRHNVQFRSKNH